MKAWPQICRIINYGPAYVGYATGVLVTDGEHLPVVLTVGHAFGKSPQERIRFVFEATGFTTKGTWRYDDEANDVTAVKLAELPPGIKPLRLAAASPPTSEPVILVGYQRDSHLQALRVPQINRVGMQNEIIQPATPLPYGFSGGAVLNTKHEVCAIIRTTGRRDSQGVCGAPGTRCGLLRRLLRWPIQHRPGIIVPKHAPQLPRDNSPPKSQPEAKSRSLASRTTRQVPASQSAVLPPSTAVASSSPSPSASRQPPRRPSTGLTGAIETLPAPGIGWWTALAGMLGIGGPVGLGIGVGAWLISRRLKSRLVQRLERSTRHGVGTSGDMAAKSAVVPSETVTPENKTTQAGTRVEKQPRYVRVVEQDPLGEAYKEAVNREIEYQTAKGNREWLVIGPRIHDMARRLAQSRIPANQQRSKGHFGLGWTD